MTGKTLHMLAQIKRTRFLWPAVCICALIGLSGVATFFAPGARMALEPSLAPVSAQGPGRNAAQPAATASFTPTLWFSSLQVPVTAPFAAGDYFDEPGFRRVPLSAPLVTPRPVPPVVSASPVVSTTLEPALPANATPEPAEIAVAQTPSQPETVPHTTVAAPSEVAQTQSTVFASLRPRPRPEQVHGIEEPQQRLALTRSRLPRARPDTVARLESSPTLAALSIAPDALSRALQQNEPVIAANASCGREHVRSIPRRRGSARDGSDVVAALTSTSGRARDDALTREILAGNLPEFARNLVPVTFESRDGTGRRTQLTICVMPDYLAVGSNRDNVRVPLGLPAATRIAAQFDMVLPTTEMVNAIYAQASVRLSPSPMEPGAQMSSTRYFMRHNATVETQRRNAGGRLGQLVSGHKKDLVLTNRLARNPGRVAIYGWHRRSGRPIQPLSTVHGAQYADYSHGIRLVSRLAYLNGRRVDLRDVLGDSGLAGLVSNEGQIRNRTLLASLNN